MFTPDRQQVRSLFFRTWQNYRIGLPLEGIEKIILDVALRHPEYHTLLENPGRYEDSDYSPEMGITNPFLHMGMHIAIEEQLSIDQPVGIRSHYQRILKQTVDKHAAQHLIMECLGEMLWQAQRSHSAPDEAVYFACLETIGS
ncbi:MAG TPA: DUF1841 family protein [Acidiferrobacterales bacterium]|nr:DUF1841 family protein [Acidiferrobacterales bacterium]